MSPEEIELWIAYEASRSSEDRNRLVERYLGLAFNLAAKYAARMPANTTADSDDVTQSAIIGLIDAVEKFDRSRGLAFTTYARTRINGEIADDAKRLDWIPNNRRRVGGDFPAIIVSGDRMDELQSEPEPDIIERGWIDHWWKLITEPLDEQEKAVVILCFRSSFTQRRIAELMELTPTRIGQIRSRALSLLRKYITTSPRCDFIRESIAEPAATA